MNWDMLTNDREAPAGSRLTSVGGSSLNAETTLALQRGVITPNAAFYLRSHFPAPRIERVAWRLALDGEVNRPLTLTFADLLALPARSLLVTLECAGNGRSAMRPAPPGEPWGYGAVSAAEWTGVPLRAALDLAGLSPAAREIVIEGADGGYVADAGGEVVYARSLSRAQALDPDVLLAYAMNGEDLPIEHGFPVRLIVPGWYGMASVKWVSRIIARAEPFDGFYQTARYVLTPASGPDPRAAPLTRMRVRSVISEPLDGATIASGDLVVRGFAWSGAGAITRVEVSADGGQTWDTADLTSAPERYAWRAWEYRWRAGTPGPLTLLSRAYDETGNQQPAEAEWNALGYANNGYQPVHVTVR